MQGLEDALHDPKVMSRYICKPRPVSPAMKTFAKKLSFRKKDDDRWKQHQDWERKAQEEIDRVMDREEEKRNKKALKHLETLCITAGAKESFWNWQVSYARNDVCDKTYLPQGGRMSDDSPGNWASRVFGNTSTPAGSPAPSIGRGGFNVFRKKASMVGLRQQSQAQLSQQRQAPVPAVSAVPDGPIPATPNRHPVVDPILSIFDHDFDDDGITLPNFPLQEIANHQAAAQTRPLSVPLQIAHHPPGM